MKISKKRQEEIVVFILFFLLNFLIYFGICALLGINSSEDIDSSEEGGSLIGMIAFVSSCFIISITMKAIINLKCKKQQDKYIDEFYNFKQKYSRQLSKSVFLYKMIDESQMKLIDSYKYLGSISDFDNIANYKTSTYEIIRGGLINLIYSFGHFRNSDFDATVELYKEMIKDRDVYSESNSSKYLNEISEILEEYM